MKFCPICPDIALEVKHNFLGTFEECSRCSYSKQIGPPKEEAVSDPINHPIHYKADIGGIECIEAIKAQLGKEGFIAFLRGQVIMSICNSSLHEAQSFLNRLIKEFNEKSN